MSLINQVLQDLQQRRAPDFDTAAATLRDVAVTPATPPPRALPPVLLWILIALLAGVSISLLWQRLSTQRATASRTAPISTHQQMPMVKTTRRAAVPSVRVSAGATAAPAPAAKAPTLATKAPAVIAAPPATPVASLSPVTSVASMTPALPTSPATTLTSAAPTAPAAPPISRQTVAIALPVVALPRRAAVPEAPQKKSALLAAPPITSTAVEKTLRPLSAEQQAELAYRDGVRLLQSGRSSIAEPRLRAALSALPTYYPARAALAALLINGNRLAEAHSLLAAGLAMAPQQASLAKLYGRLLIEQGHAEQARAVLERAAPPVASDPEYYSLLAALYQRLGLYAQAAQTYRGILQTEPRNGVWWLGLGMALEGTGDAGDARQAYERAQQSGTLNPAVLQYVQAKLAALQ